MEPRHTLSTRQTVALLSFLLLTACSDRQTAESFLPDPMPGTSAERMAVVDSLRSVVKVGRRDESPLAGRWEIMNMMQTAVSVATENEMFETLGTIIIYTEKKSVLLDDACADTGYTTREIPFDEYFLDYDVSPDQLKITTEPIEVTTLTCGGLEWDVPGAEVIRVAENRLMFNWDGLLYVLWR